MVSCDEWDRRADLAIEHSELVIEVLSDSAAAYDCGTKFAAYRVPSIEPAALSPQHLVTVQINSCC